MDRRGVATTFSKFITVISKETLTNNGYLISNGELEIKGGNFINKGYFLNVNRYILSNGNVNNYNKTIFIGINNWTGGCYNDLDDEAYLCLGGTPTVSGSTLTPWKDHDVPINTVESFHEVPNNPEIIRPTVYLKSSIKITGENGTKQSPYELG